MSSGDMLSAVALTRFSELSAVWVVKCDRSHPAARSLDPGHSQRPAPTAHRIAGIQWECRRLSRCLAQVSFFRRTDLVQQ